MGGKRKGKKYDDDDDFGGQQHQKTYQSEANKAQSELREAKQRELLNQESEPSLPQEGGKKNKRKKNKQLDDDFDAFAETGGEPAAATKKAEEEKEAQIGEKPVEDDDFDDMNIGGKKKKKKGKNKDNAVQESVDPVDKGKDMLDVMGEDSEGEATYLNKRRKGKENKKKFEHKKKKKQQSDDEEEEEEGEAKQEDEKQEEEPQIDSSAQQQSAQDEPECLKGFGEGPPFYVVYCYFCGVPPEYCAYMKKDLSECQQWLEANHPVLFKEVYGGEPSVKKKDQEENKQAEGDDEKQIKEKKEGEEGDLVVKKPKKKAKQDGIIKIYKFHRGRKTECKMVGFEFYSKDLKDLASRFGKKFCCGCNVITDDVLGECINIQGDVENGDIDLWEWLESDKFMSKLNIDTDKIEFEDKGNKKGRKRN